LTAVTPSGAEMGDSKKNRNVFQRKNHEKAGPDDGVRVQEEKKALSPGHTPGGKNEKRQDKSNRQNQKPKATVCVPEAPSGTPQTLSRWAKAPEQCRN